MHLYAPHINRRIYLYTHDIFYIHLNSVLFYAQNLKVLYFPYKLLFHLVKF